MNVSHYHVGLKKDAKRGAIPIQAFRAGGTTLHFRTATYDREQGDYLHKAGQIAKLTPEQYEAIKTSLRVDRAPADLDREVVRDKDGKESFKDSRAEKYRAPDKATGVGSSFKVLDYRDVCGFGKVVQWSAVHEDDKNPNRVTGWISKVLDLQDRDYQPLENPEDEVPLHEYVFSAPVTQDDFNPPSIDLGDADEKNADGIEREEEKRDPVGFEKTKERMKRAKASGIPLEVHTPSA